MDFRTGYRGLTGMGVLMSGALWAQGSDHAIVVKPKTRYPVEATEAVLVKPNGPTPPAIDLSLRGGSGYYVPKDLGYRGLNAQNQKVLLAGFTLEILEPHESESCTPALTCAKPGILVKMWPTVDSPASTPVEQCACVMPGVFRHLPSASEAPGFLGVSTQEGKNLMVLYKTDPNLKVYRADGSTVNPSNFAGLLTQDLGPAGRDSAGNPYRFARFLKPRADVGVEPISDEYDNIYLIRDGGALPSAQSALSHTLNKNLYRDEGPTKTTLDRVEHKVDARWQFLPDNPDSNKGFLYQVVDGMFQPVNQKRYGLWENHTNVPEGFRDMRTQPVHAKMLQSHFASVQRMPDLSEYEEAPAPVLPTLPPPQAVKVQPQRMPEGDFLRTFNRAATSREEQMIRTMNAYISEPQHEYTAQDLLPNKYGKIQMRFHDRPPGRDVYTKTEGGFSKQLAIDAKGPQGAYGLNYLHYNTPVHERDDRDMWAQPEVVCSVHVFASEWKKRCVREIPRTKNSQEREQMAEACTLQIGDMSMSNVQGWARGTKCSLGHASHFAGNCVDIRPVQKDKLIKSKVSGGSPADLQTQRVLDFAKSIGAITNVPGWNPIWQTREDHKDHFHVCFPLATPPHPALAKLPTVPKALQVGHNSQVAEQIRDGGVLRGCYGI